MPLDLSSWMQLSQVFVQRIALTLLVGLAAAGSLWCVAAATGLAPWLALEVGVGGETPVDAGKAIQLVLTLFLLGLCHFVPMNSRVMRLELSHRKFEVGMWDVARAYQIAHAADRDALFQLEGEFDGIRERLKFLRSHPDLGSLEPEILELAAQMSHESRELAEIYSNERVERARAFLQQRRREAEQMKERVQTAHSVCRDLKRLLRSVELDEEVVRTRLAQFKADLEDLLPILDLRPADPPYANVELLRGHRVPAE
jgi:hypothetical protein